MILTWFDELGLCQGIGHSMFQKAMADSDCFTLDCAPVA